MPKKPKPNIIEVTQNFGLAHKVKAEAEKEMGKYRKQFFDVIEIPESKLAQQIIYVETDDPERYVATLYPKWRILRKQRRSDNEWRIAIQEDPAKKTYHFVNPVDKKVYQRTVAESAPDVDLERLKKEKPLIYESVTFQPEAPRELKALEDLTDDQKEIIKAYLTEPKLTNRMESPRPAKPEELEGLE